MPLSFSIGTTGTGVGGLVGVLVGVLIGAFVGAFVGVGVGSTPKRSEVKRATTTSPLLPKAACAPPAVPGKFMEVVLPATYTSPAAFEGEKVRICCFLLFS